MKWKTDLQDKCEHKQVIENGRNRMIEGHQNPREVELIHVQCVRCLKLLAREWFPKEGE